MNARIFCQIAFAESKRERGGEKFMKEVAVVGWRGLATGDDVSVYKAASSFSHILAHPSIGDKEQNSLWGS